MCTELDYKNCTILLKKSHVYILFIQKNRALNAIYPIGILNLKEISNLYGYPYDNY